MTRPRAAQAVPCGLLENGKVTKPIKKGELITYGNVAVDQASRIVALRKRQDELLARISMMAKPVAMMKGDAASNQRPFYRAFHA